MSTRAGRRAKGRRAKEKEVEPEVTSVQAAPEGSWPFLLPDQYSDVIITVGGGKLFSNKCLLAYHSPVLADVVAGGNNGGRPVPKSKGGGNKEATINMPDKEYDDIIEFLCYIDPRVDHEMTDQAAMRLLPLAEEYDMVRLKRKCEEAITESFKGHRKGRRLGEMQTDLNLWFLHVADKYQFASLLNSCEEECICNNDPISTSMLVNNPDISDAVKLQIMNKKLARRDKQLDRERRERSSMEFRYSSMSNLSDQMPWKLFYKPKYQSVSGLNRLSPEHERPQTNKTVHSKNLP